MKIIDVNTVYGAGTSSNLKNSYSDLEKYIADNGITQALTLSSSGYKFNFSVGNEETLEDLKSSMSLLPVATIDPRGFFGESFVLSKIKSDGFKAIKFFPHLQGWKCDNLVFRDILKINSEIKLPFIVNTPDFGDISLLDKVYNYDFPIICSGVSYINASEFVAFAKKHKNVYTDCSAFNAHYVLYQIIEYTSVDRILFGSNAPKDLAKVIVDYILNADLSDSDKEKIFSGNILNII